MPNKRDIIENVEQYSAQQLCDYIKTGVVTFAELCEETEGYLPAPLRKEIEKLLDTSEEDDWSDAKRKRTKDSLMGYLKAYPQGCHRDEARTLLKSIQGQSTHQSIQDEWDSVDKDDVEKLKDFVNRHPKDSLSQEARKLISSLMIDDPSNYDADSLISIVNTILTDNNVTDKDAKIFQTINDLLNQNKISTEVILDIISKDNNFLRASVVRMLINKGNISYDDLGKCGINEKFIKYLAKGQKAQSFKTPEKLDQINKLCTEVYFWGIPSSGKSCALGAILSVANNGKIARSMSKNNDCQGYGYMTRLATLFRCDGSVGTLPEGTSIYSTYEMGFDLEDEKGSTHPITCIDLAGELVRCMYKFDAKEPLSDDEKEALSTLTRILVDNRTKNRKIHFFVLEYGGENRSYEGLSQTEYLDAALQYIRRTGIFKNDTDAIYLMFTKVDKTHARGSELIQILINYTDDYYRGFFQGLEKICKDYEINGGKVERIPFTLGKVCFQDYCLFEESSAANVVKKLLTRSKGFKRGKIHNILNKFKG